MMVLNYTYVVIYFVFSNYFSFSQSQSISHANCRLVDYINGYHMIYLSIVYNIYIYMRHK